MEANKGYNIATNHSSSNQSQAAFNSSLHSIRKPPSKPWKKPVAPLPATPAKVYKVDPVDFRQVVQTLTGAPEFAPERENTTNTTQVSVTSSLQLQPPFHRRLQNVAPSPLKVGARSMTSNDFPAPLELLNSPEKTPLSAVYREMMGESIDTKQPWVVSESLMASSMIGIGLSPSSQYSWRSFPVLSPGTLSNLEESRVL